MRQKCEKTVKKCIFLNNFEVLFPYVLLLVVIVLLQLNLTDLRSAQSTSDRFELLLSDFQPAEVGWAGSKVIAAKLGPQKSNLKKKIRVPPFQLDFQMFFFTSFHIFVKKREAMQEKCLLKMRLEKCENMRFDHVKKCDKCKNMRKM